MALRNLLTRTRIAAAALRIPTPLQKLPKAKPPAPFEIQNIGSASTEELRTKARMLNQEVDSIFESIEPYEKAFAKIVKRVGMVTKINVLGYVAIPAVGWLASYYKSSSA